MIFIFPPKKRYLLMPIYSDFFQLLWDARGSYRRSALDCQCPLSSAFPEALTIRWTRQRSTLLCHQRAVLQRHRLLSCLTTSAIPSKCCHCLLSQKCNVIMALSQSSSLGLHRWNFDFWFYSTWQQFLHAKSWARWRLCMEREHSSIPL